MRKYFFVIILFVFGPAFMSYSLQNNSTNIRGQVKLVINPFDQTVPFINISVKLFQQTGVPGQEYQLISKTYTDREGFFYFYKITPNRKYFLKVNDKKNYEIKVIPMKNNPDDFQDLPVLLYPIKDKGQ